MELNIKVWKPKPKLKNQERQFLMVNDQWTIDNADLLRNGGFEIDETFEPKVEPIKEEIHVSNEGEEINKVASENENTLFDFDKKEVEIQQTKTQIVKPKKNKQ